MRMKKEQSKWTALDKGAKLLLSALIVLSILTKALAVAFPLLVQRTIDAGVRADWALITTFIISLCVVAITNGIVDMTDQVVENKYSNHIAHNYRKGVSNYILQLEPNEYAKRERSDYVSIFNNNITMVVDNYYIMALNVMKCALVVVFTVGALFSLNIILTIIIIVTSVLTVFVPFIFRNILNCQNNAINSAMKNLNAKLDDFLQGYITGRIFRAQGKFQKRMLDSSENLSHQNVKYWKLMQEPNAATMFLTVSRDILLVGVGVYLMAKGDLTVGALFAAVQLSNLLTAPAVHISYLISSMMSTKDMKKELDDMCAEDDGRFSGKTQSESTKPTQLPIAIEIKGLSFSYGQKQVLNNINLQLSAGEKYLLVGASGSGKSSLLLLLAGLNHHYSGEIQVDSKELREWSNNEWYERIAVAVQDSNLFHDTLYHNMTLWDSLSNEHLDAKILELNLTNLVEINGLKNDCLNGGNNYSGGEQQRIALIRVLLEEKRLLLIDEATSALDNINYLRVEHLLLQKTNCTIINITHKINSEIAKQYDGVIFLADGKVIAMGAYEQLLKTSPEFKRFVNADS